MYQEHLHHGEAQHLCHNVILRIFVHLLRFPQQKQFHLVHTKLESGVTTIIALIHTKAEYYASTQNRFFPNAGEQTESFQTQQP